MNEGLDKQYWHNLLHENRSANYKYYTNNCFYSVMLVTVIQLTWCEKLIRAVLYSKSTRKHLNYE